MVKRREIIRQCNQIRDLIGDNKYTKALEMIDGLPLEAVESLDDLYLYAEMYEKAERMEKKKEIYYLIFERTKSRHVLNRLLRLTIRLGDMEEARDLYFSYEVMGGATLDLYELRYLLAKAEGEPRSRLIEILEDLKKEEYTEEWGFQLARLYEQEGLREKCIQECKDLKLWFGKGEIVDKANELQGRCEAPDWKPPVEEEIPEVEAPDTQEEIPVAEEPETQEEIPVAEEPETQEEIPVVEEPETQKEDVYTEPAVAVTEEKEESDDELDPSAPFRESVSEPVVVKGDKPRKNLLTRPKLTPEQLEELKEEDSEDISQHGICYRTLKSTIYHVRYGKDKPHFVFAGGEERITRTVAKRITKELNRVGYVSARSIVKITAEKLNEIELLEQIEKLNGGCMLVTSAPELSIKAVNDLLVLLKEHGDSIIVMLAGPFDEMDCFLDIYKELSEYFTYKVRL